MTGNRVSDAQLDRDLENCVRWHDLHENGRRASLCLAVILLALPLALLWTGIGILIGWAVFA